MRATKLQELEEMAVELLEIAHKLPPGQNRHNAIQEIERFRVKIADLQRSFSRAPHRGLKAKQK